MENIFKIDLKEILHKLICLFIVAICFALFFQFTQQSINNSLTRNIENQSNHAIFAVNY